METKINVAAIIKDKPQGTKLYADAFGELSIEDIYAEGKDELGITLSSKDGDELLFYNDGKYNVYGEPILVPSKNMRDWEKFAWKRGDVLVNKDGDVYIIFERFSDDTYCSFVGKYYLWKENNDTEHFYENERLLTSDFQKAGKDAAQTYIKIIEEKLEGKLNLESLEIEKTQPEFKDGDVLFVKCEERDFIEIFNYSKKNGDLCDYASLDTLAHHLDISGKYKIGKEDIVKIRLATGEEKRQLFDALVKEGKAWDAEKKLIVDLKPKVEFKPFDKVLCRNFKDDTWEADFFARLTRKEIDYTQSSKYLCVGDLWMYCIPYNEETAHLLGTTDEWKGGEG